MTAFMILLLVTLVGTIIGLTYSALSVRDSLLDRNTISSDQEAEPSEKLEARRHFVQQALRTFKLVLLTSVLVIAIREWPPDAELRSWFMRILLASTILLIAASAVFERRANKRIVNSVLRERRKRQ